jgi:hypothetical protein
MRVDPPLLLNNSERVKMYPFKNGTNFRFCLGLQKEVWNHCGRAFRQRSVLKGTSIDPSLPAYSW